MVTTKSEDVTKLKYSAENSVFEKVFDNLSLEFVWEGVGWGWALINFFCL